jgi:S-adenosylmethionine synthetase
MKENIEKKLKNCSRKISSEYVSSGHPDKIADQIADAIVDEYIKQDVNSRCGIEVMVKDNIVVLGGEVYSTGKVDYDSIIRLIYDKLNFPSNHNLIPENIKIINLIGKQSREIHQAVDKVDDDEIGSGDQGCMFGFASNDTNVYLPLGHYIAKTIANYVSKQPFLGPDCKSQVIINENESGEKEIEYILVSVMYQMLEIDVIRADVKNFILKNVIGLPHDIFKKYINSNIEIDINPCGSWHIGGPISDAGVTGRKLVVDAYGGYARIGGGNSSGKDLTKVDRSAQYCCRWLAKNIVASGIADTAEVGLSYAIGVPEPCSINIELNRNCETVPLIERYIRNYIGKLTPKFFINKFKTIPRNYILSRDGHYGVDLSNDKYVYGLKFNPFGDDNDKYLLSTIYPWEVLDFAEDLKFFLNNR